ncbi:MAG: hypothetical protein ACYSUQ_06610 [Planctomycetota bacterium]|jgi:hypothetical protein
MNVCRIAAYAIVAVCGVVVLTGCDKLTRSRFEMIQLDHAERFDVDKTIGPPDSKLPDYWLYERVDKHLNVFIHYNEQGKVWRKEWHDTLNDDHYDSTEPPEDASSYESTEIRRIN